MRFFCAIPAFLSSIILAAHFLRSSQYVLVGISIAMAILAFFRYVPLKRIVQIFLLAGSLVWLWTMVDIAQVRAEMGGNVMRMMIIMCGVSLFTIVSAMLLSLNRRRQPVA